MHPPKCMGARLYSPPCKGADGVVARKLHFALRLETWRVSDHPVCGASVDSRLFIYAAATPPLQGGECAHPEQFFNSLLLHFPGSLTVGYLMPSCSRYVLYFAE